MKAKYLVPNGFTTLSMMLGLASVTRSAVGDYELAAWMILWGVLLDKLDGTAARLLNASSDMGAELDSFADFVVFGIAPAALFFFHLGELGTFAGGRQLILLGALGTYVLAVACRLARFNVTTPPGGNQIFYGIPTTLIGAIVASGYLAWTKYELSPTVLTYCPVYLVIAAVAMVSNLRLPKLKLRRSKAFNAFQFANVAICYVLGPLRLFPEYMFGLAVTYTVVGVLWSLWHPPATQTEPEPEQQPT